MRNFAPDAKIAKFARRLLRPQAAAIVVAATLVGCSSESGSDWASIGKMVQDYWNGPKVVTLQQAGAVPYASIGVRIGTSAQALLVLAYSSDSDFLWVSGKSVSLTTRNGRLVRTAGFESNLAGFMSGPGLPETETATTWSEPRSFSWFADFSSPARFSVQVKCERTPDGPESIALLGTTIQTLKVEERCTAAALDWSFTNVFWVDAKSGFVWKSIQYVTPDLDPLDIEVMRPPE
jgi:hypothetical protein